jgi:serine/threonine protein kinase
LVGTQIGTLYHHEPYPSVPSGFLFKLEIKISEQFKRVFFLEERHQVEAWTKKLREVVGYRSLTDYFEFTQMLGEGSFGRVFKARYKKNRKKYVAIK